MTKYNAWMVVVLLLVTWLVARSTTADPIWYDEHRSFYYAGWDEPGHIPLLQTVQRVRESDVQAPGYYALLNGWGWLLGQSPFSGRVLSLFIGVMAVAAVYRAGANLSTRGAGVAAALMLGTSAFFIVYAHEIRTYAALVLFIALGLAAYLRLTRRFSVPAAAVMVISLGVLPYLHYLSALAIVAVGIYHLLTYRSTRHWWLVAVCIGLAGLLFVPWAFVAVQATVARATTIRSTVPTMTFPTIITTTGTEFSNGNVALLLLLLAFGLRGGRFAWLTAVLMLLLVYAFDRVIPVLNHPRYLIVLWAFVALLAGLGAERLSRLGVPLVLVLAVWALPGITRATERDYRLYANGPGAYAAWDFAGSYLRERLQADDRVALHLPYDTIYVPYHEPVADYYLGDLPVDTAGIESRRLQPDADYLRIGMERVQDAERVWYLRELNNLPERFGLFDRAMKEMFAHCGAILHNERYLLDLYIEPPNPDDVAMRFSEGIALVPYFDFDDNTGDWLYLTSGWIVADSVLPHTYSVALHLLNADGELVAQADYGLPGAGANCGYGLLDISALPPGDYTATVSVYAWETGERLTGQVVDSGDTAERLPLGVISR